MLQAEVVELADLPAGRQARTALENMFFVYILESFDKHTYYKGLTKAIDKRLNEHAKGKVHTTKRLRPLRLMHVEICEDRLKARTLEKYFKSGYGREIIKEIANYT